MSLHEKMMGKNRENIPNWAFKLMSFIMKMIDIFGDHANKNFKTLEIKKGQIVVDYGCGPARYIENISKAVGEDGMLYATDIHPLAIKKTQSKIKKLNLHNAEALLCEGYKSPIQDNSIDVVLALDMFHMVEDSNALLKEFKRIVKIDGYVIIEDGHQSRQDTRKKILDSRYFKIEAQNINHVKCKQME